MTGKPFVAPNEPQEAPDWHANPKGEASALIQFLDRLRETLFQRLDEVEALALEQTALLNESPSGRERALRERVMTLETAQARLLAESKRREQEWQAVLEQLDEDRRLLAEAWEEVERERVEGSTSRPAERPTPPNPADPPPTRPPAVESTDDPVTRAILWQFQTLKGDVRNNAKGRNGR
jgi:hypothetical protein